MRKKKLTIDEEERLRKKSSELWVEIKELEKEIIELKKGWRVES